jgi:NAD(P)-dependent dehydrogenase (short-subunit alcohol dehydrogenase family)
VLATLRRIALGEATSWVYRSVSMGALSGQRILITGVSRGVGLETARLFLAEGAEILGVARDHARLEAARLELDPSGKRLTVLAAELAADDTPSRVARAVEERWGALDVLFNNAGVQIDRGALGITTGPESVFHESLATNLTAPYRLCRALLPLLRKGKAPRIVNVSSGAGNFASMRMRDIPTYRLSKFALNGLTLLLAGELEGVVSVNAFDPGWVKTDLGGPNAPGVATESARGALALVTQPWEVSGKFWKDGSEIPF